MFAICKFIERNKRNQRGGHKKFEVKSEDENNNSIFDTVSLLISKFIERNGQNKNEENKEDEMEKVDGINNFRLDYVFFSVWSLIGQYALIRRDKVRKMKWKE